MERRADADAQNAIATRDMIASIVARTEVAV